MKAQLFPMWPWETISKMWRLDQINSTVPLRSDILLFSKLICRSKSEERENLLCRMSLGQEKKKQNTRAPWKMQGRLPWGKPSHTVSRVYFFIIFNINIINERIKFTRPSAQVFVLTKKRRLHTGLYTSVDEPPGMSFRSIPSVDQVCFPEQYSVHNFLDQFLPHS